jgi:transcription antitermination factor NusG
MSYWAVARTESQREQVAARHLVRRGFESYLPRIKVRKHAEPLFPGYVFVRIVQHWHAVNATIGILHVLLAGDCPAVLAQAIIDEIRARENRHGFIRLPKKIREPGAKVRITRGMFADHPGIYDGASREDRERVLLEILGRKVGIDFEPGDLEFVA